MGYKMHVVWEQDWEDRLEGKWQESRGVHSPSANDASCYSHLFPQNLRILPLFPQNLQIFLYFCSNYVLRDLRSLLPSCFHHCAFTHYALPVTVGLHGHPCGSVEN